MSRHSSRIELCGQTFGHWAVLHAGERRNRATMWVCQCSCGAIKEVASNHLRGGRSTNCGCVAAARQADRLRTHGKRGTAEYRSWRSMITRCTNPRRREWPHYGGRGIVVCDRWRESFDAFLADMGSRPSPTHTLDRIDVDGPYGPENCRWATRHEQSRNTRRNRIVVYDGREMPLVDAARLAGVNYYTAAWRLSKGASDEEALR